VHGGKNGVVIVDCAIYVEGGRVPGEHATDSVLATARALGGFVWLGLHEPTEGEFEDVAVAFDLHPLAVEDAIHAHQRPKIERYGDSEFVVFKPARYVDIEEVIEVGELMAFVGPDFIVTVRHGEPASLTDMRRALECDPSRMEWGPSSVLYAIADKVVDDYATVMLGVANDIDQIENEVFSGPKATHADHDRRDLRHELRAHARARVEVRLPVRAGDHAGVLLRPLPQLQTPRLAVAPVTECAWHTPLQTPLVRRS
jgi:magnesium transporter